MAHKETKHFYSEIPETPGVYFMRDKKGDVLYIGKAGNLKRRVSSYFLRPNNMRIATMVSRIHSIDTKQTDSALEALILESALIKKYQPPFNIKEKDDTSFLYIVITKEEFPRVISVRGKDLKTIKGMVFGPYVSAGSVREALRLLRPIFPWHTHEPEKVGSYKRPCFEYEVGLCPGVCVGKITKEEYKKNIKNLVLLFKGKKKEILMELETEMKRASENLEFEVAQKIKKQIFALTHIRDTALISEDNIRVESDTVKRIECYDISNISGTSPVGSMVVFENKNGEWRPEKNEYKKFKIKTVVGPNDFAMLSEVLTRRFKHAEWQFPDCVVVDGGTGQVSAAIEALKELQIKIPILGIAKGAERKRNDIVGEKPEWLPLEVIIKARDEAHRFAVKYHKEVRGRQMFL